MDQYIGPSLADVPGPAPSGMQADNPGLTPPEPAHLDKLSRWAKSVNIALELDDDENPEIGTDVLTALGMRVSREYKIDETSRADWKEKTEQAMDLAMQHTMPKQYPWPKAANVIFPLMTTAAMQFAARAYPAIVMGREIVKGIVIGPDTGTPQIDPQTGQPAMQPGLPDPQGQPVPVPVWKVPPGAKQVRADKIGEHMSYQLLDEQPEW